MCDLVSLSPKHSPAYVCVCSLTQCAVVSLESVCAGLILCCTAVECVSLSRRFIPELINYLLGLLHLAVPTHTCTGNTHNCANNTYTCTCETVYILTPLTLINFYWKYAVLIQFKFLFVCI